MVQYSRVLAQFFGHPWALEENKFRIISDFLRRKAMGAFVPDQEIEAAVAQRRAGGYSLAARGTAVIQVFGVMANRLSSVEESSGGVSAETIAKQLDAAAADPQVRKIVMQFDSPGGSVYGLSELCAKLRKVTASKKTIAVADQCACSAAYGLASQCSEFYASPSAIVGSVGTIAEHVDLTRQLDAEGVKVTVVTAGKFKAEGHPAQPLSDEGLAYLQSMIDSYYGMLVSDVAKGRKVSESDVKKNYGQGRALTAADALAAGMIDGIKPFERVMSDLTGGIAKDAVMARARVVAIGAK